jgi:hypothetical protein
MKRFPTPELDGAVNSIYDTFLSYPGTPSTQELKIVPQHFSAFINPLKQPFSILFTLEEPLK